MASSLELAKQTTISWDEFLHRVRTGRYSDADLKRTKWYQAGHALELEAKAPPPPPAHPPGNRCIYFSEVTDHAINVVAALGPGYTALFSADLNLSRPGFKFYVTNDQLGLLRRAGVGLASWCDCSATPYSAAVGMKDNRSLDFAGGQAENPEQYLHATQGGARHVVGEPAVLAQDPDVLKDAIRRSYDGSLAFIGEVMHPQPNYSAQGVNITSACLFVDRDAAQGGYLPLDAYGGMDASLRKGCSLFAGGRMQDNDWTTYSAWTN